MNETQPSSYDWWVQCTLVLVPSLPSGNVGTVHWTAPEVMANQRYQFPADVYSLGMVLYEMVTGLIPFHELIPVAVMMAVAINRQQPQIPESVPLAVATVIRQ